MLALSSPVDLAVDEFVARGRFRLSDGEELGFALSHRLSSETPPSFWHQQEIAGRLDD